MNFNKVLRMAMRYRWTFMGSIFCALAVAVLWGGNIGGVYPIMQVLLKGESVQHWVAKEIAACEKKIADKSAEIDALTTQASAAVGEEKSNLEKTIADKTLFLGFEKKALAAYQFAQPYVEQYLPHDPFKTIVFVLSILLFSTIVKDLFLVANSVLSARMSQLATYDLRMLFFRRTLGMDLAAFGEDGTADLMSRFTNDMNQVGVGVETLFGKMIREPLKLIACLIGAAVISWRLLLLSMVVAPVAGYLIQWLAKSLKRANRRAMEEMAGMFGTLEEVFRSIKIVKAFTNERQERRRFHNNTKGYLRKAIRISAYDSLVHPMTETVGIAAVSVAICAGAWMVLNHQTHLLGLRMSERPMELESLLLFFGFLIGAADPLRKFSDVFSRLQGGTAACDRIFSRLEREPKTVDPKTPVPITRHHLHLVFDKVKFGYVPGKTILHDLNLNVRAGETIAIVGPNGCGKSTLTHLVPRFADPDSGQIRLDGVPLTEMRMQDLRRQIGLVTQETVLFEDTILNNIRYGSPHATREEAIEAAKQAHAHSFIERDLPQGYDTDAGALGNRLSGGQRQRIALARAILRNPSILILDEATSQVDLESEQAIQKTLEKFVRNRTTIIVTHRLSILALADRIIVMQDGRIIDVGRHEELLARCSLYGRLHQIQFEDLRQTA